MSTQRFKDSTSTHATFFSGPFSDDYAKLFSLWSLRNNEDPDCWPLSVEASLREPTLGDVTFEITYRPDEVGDIAAMCQSLIDSGDDENKSKSWERLTRFLLFLLDHA